MFELDSALLELAGLFESPGGAVEVSSAEFGKRIGVSQQTASRYLVSLAREGLIERKVTGLGQELRLTEKGLSRLRGIHSRIGLLFSKKPKSLSGIVVSGLAEGAYYVREYSERIKEKTGYAPHPGTLNLRVSEKPVLPQNPEVIPSFSRGARTFGEVRLYSVELSAKKRKASAHLIVPDRTHHRDELEFIARENIRKKLGISDGDGVTVTLC
jgi:riboflavin kinase